MNTPSQPPSPLNGGTAGTGSGKRFAANSAIVLSFIVALEFVIMISPFAFVFYAALNPFLLALNQSALTGGHHHMMTMAHHDPSLHNSPMMKRRIIFLDLSGEQRPLTSPADGFGINVRRAPLFFVDVHLHTGEVLRVQDLAGGSGWGKVPTPMF